MELAGKVACWLGEALTFVLIYACLECPLLEEGGSGTDQQLLPVPRITGS